MLVTWKTRWSTINKTCGNLAEYYWYYIVLCTLLTQGRHHCRRVTANLGLKFARRLRRPLRREGSISYFNKKLSVLRPYLVSSYLDPFEIRVLWLIDWTVFYAVLAIFKPNNGGTFEVRLQYIVKLRLFIWNVWILCLIHVIGWKNICIGAWNTIFPKNKIIIFNFCMIKNCSRCKIQTK